MSTRERHPLVQAMTVTGRLPRAEIAAAIEHLAEVTPDLLAVVERAAEAPPEGEAEGNLVFFALHILSTAREQRLRGPLMRYLRRPEAEIDEVLGEAETETLGKMIAGGFDGNATDLFELARNPERDEFLRGSVMGAIAFLTWDGRIDPAETRRFLEQFDDERIVPAEDNGWFSWSMMVELLGWTDLVPLVEQAYADGRVWAGMSSIENFREGLAKTLTAAPDDASRFDADGQGYFTGALEELGKYRFDPPQEPKLLPAPAPRMPEGLEKAVRSTPWAEPVRNPMRHVGRNDPCPCSSGKKYKKCCLAA
jgi:hypothetical protein